MSAQLLLAFAATCVLLALTPGPNMALIVASTASHGLRAGLATLAGTATGLVLLVTAAAIHDLGGGTHGGLVRCAALDRRLLSGVARLAAAPLLVAQSHGVGHA